MNNVILNYILKNFLKKFFILTFLFYCFGVIFNLFEEVEFFKDTQTSIFLPLMLTFIFIPSLIIKILPFIIFISSMWFIVSIRNNKDLLILKVFGYSNLKIFILLATTSFFLGWMIMVCANPFTSAMSKQYEKTKSNYSKDIDHLITFNSNGLWIKDNYRDNDRIISAIKPEGKNLLDVSIFQLDNNSNITERILSKKANITNNEWVLTDVTIYKSINGLFKSENFDYYTIQTKYNYEKITNLFKNFDTMSFLDLLFDYDKMLNTGYNKSFLDKSLHTYLSLPFFLLVMTGLASVITLNTLKRADNTRYFVVGILSCVTIFYLKDLSLALGETDRISLILSIWAPIIAISLFIFIGVLQINEK